MIRGPGRSLRVLLAPWAVAAVVSFAVLAHEAAAHTGAGAQPTDPVHIPDANLRAKVEAALNKASGEAITHAEMAGLRTCIYADPTGCLQLVGPFSDQFNVAGRIHDLTGLEHATGLTRVRLRYHPISDLTPLAGLTSLTELTLIHADVQDLTRIAGLTNLQILQLPESHRISDLTPLAGLTSLRQLSLTVNRVSDLTPLAGLTGLTRLYLSDNRISDLTPLAGLTSLEHLTLAGNRITNIEPLRGMTSLTRLTLQENYRLRDLSPLSGLTSIFYFDLDAIGVEDVKPLVDNPGLGSGDYVSLDDVTTLNADAAGHIATLRGRGVTVWGGDVEEARRWQVQNVRATPGPERLTVAWDPLPDAENPKTRTKPQGYKVQWRSGAQHWSDTVTYKHSADYADVPGMDRHRVVSGVNTTSYTIPGLTPGVAYTVRVKPDFGTFYEGAPSDEDTDTPLSREVHVQEPEPGEESLTISWKTVAGALGYQVQWAPERRRYDEYPDQEDQCVPTPRVCVSTRDVRTAGAGGSIPVGLTTTYTISNLDPAVTYRVGVTPILENGMGQATEVTGTPRRKKVVVSIRKGVVRIAQAATAVEGEAAELRVALDEPAEALVTVGWTTEDGTARAGEDYLAAGGRLTFRPGDREMTLQVETLDDRRVEPSETFRVRLMDAVNAEPAPEAALGTVTITDDDTGPARARAMGMVLAGMGRWVAADAVDVIEGRLAPRAGAEAALGGRALDLAALGSRKPARSAAPGAQAASGGSSGAVDPQAAARAAGYRYRHDVHRDGFGRARRTVGSFEADGLRPWTPREPAEDVPVTELLSRSRFDLPLRRQDAAAGGASGGTTGWRVWGQGAVGGFDSRSEAGFRVDGDLAGGYLGLDYRPKHDVLLGMAISLAEGDFDYEIDEVTTGALDLEMRSVLPYAHWKPRSDLGVWGLLGAGQGDAELKDEAGRAEADLTMRMAAGGLRREMAAWRGIDLAWKADAFLSELETDAAEGLPQASGDARRIRLRLEGRRQWEISPVSQMMPSLEVGGRWDGGRAETGLGMEVGGGLAYSHAALGLEVEARGRFLLAHREDAFDEWGGSLTAKLDPGQPEEGPWMRIAPGWGQEGSRMAQIWDGRDVFRAVGGPEETLDPSPDRLELEAGYGQPTRARAGLLTSYAGLSMAGSKRIYRVGRRLKLESRANLGVEGRQSVQAGETPKHEVTLYLNLPW